MREAEPEDLTGRARVRNAALAEFAEQGFRGSSMRSVAARAGVSPGLVQHHFRTKQALREACDEYVVGYVGRAALEGVAAGRLGEPDFLAALLAESAVVGGYLARSLSEGTAASGRLFDDLVTVTEDYLAKLPEPVEPTRSGVPMRDRAVVLTAMRLSTLVLSPHLARGMGLEDSGVLGGAAGSGAARVAAATASLLHPDLIPGSARAEVRAELRAQQRSEAVEEER